ncbi:hypothetical protein BC628DRAFT_1403161 [Trametes gibbosa]|nr:hypothetical protein BC628DRAFT_1403161 [Trametes gibbosa]
MTLSTMSPPWLVLRPPARCRRRLSVSLGGLRVLVGGGGAWTGSRPVVLLLLGHGVPPAACVLLVFLVRYMDRRTRRRWRWDRDAAVWERQGGYGCVRTAGASACARAYDPRLRGTRRLRFCRVSSGCRHRTACSSDSFQKRAGALEHSRDDCAVYARSRRRCSLGGCGSPAQSASLGDSTRSVQGIITWPRPPRRSMEGVTRPSDRRRLGVVYDPGRALAWSNRPPATYLSSSSVAAKLEIPSQEQCLDWWQQTGRAHVRWWGAIRARVPVCTAPRARAYHGLGRIMRRR